MKYKNIYSAIHNFGHSFTSMMNYVDGDYVIDELSNIHQKEYDIEVDWISGEFEPNQLASNRIEKSLSNTQSNLKTMLLLCSTYSY